MRKHHVCPKCRHNHILLIESVPYPGEYEAETRHLHIAEIFVGEGWLGDKTSRAGKLSAAVCRRCGYAELYVTDAPLIPVDGRYVREVVGPEGGDQSPYR
jgi:predicted nucleic-acid-binding Zn-ribbon protein